MLRVCALAAAALAVGACVERKITVRSDPPGARVALDGRPIGVTPVTVRFEQYGGREFTLAKKGHLRLREIRRIEPPLYQRLGIDFFFEMVWPFPLVDEHVETFDLTPVVGLKSDEPLDTAAIGRRAQEMQERADTYGIGTP